MTVALSPDSTTPAAHSATRVPLSWAIVGGGVLGLELARQLRLAGDNVTVLEASPTLGGLADAWQVGELTWDRHYHVTLLSDTRLRRLLEELDLAQTLQWVQTRTGFYTDGKLYSMSNSLEFLKFPPLGLLDKLRLAATIFYASKIRNWRRLESIAVTDWLRRWSGPRTTEKIWLPLLRAKLGENYKHASASFIWAIIARMYAARRSGLKKEMFGYVLGGYARIHEHFVCKLESLGVVLQTSTPVKAINRHNNGLRIETPQGDQTFDRVIVTAACPAVRRICTDLNPAEKATLDAIRYQGIVCASVVLKKPVAGYYVTNITDGWVPFTAVIEMTALVDSAEFGGKHLIYLPKYVDPQDPLFDQSDEAIQESFISGLCKMYPHLSPDDVEGFRVSRVRNVLAISTLNYSERLPAMTTSVPGLFVVNSSQITNGTLNVNETLMLADRALATIQSEILK